MRQCLRQVLLLLAVAVALPKQINALDLAEETVPFSDVVGLTCSSRPDCGYLPGLACINGLCEYCQHDSDCAASSTDDSKRCHVSQVLDSLTQKLVTQYGVNSKGDDVPVAFCVEKDLFSPFTWNDVLATIIAFISTALGSGCGVGGGGLLVPMYIFVIGLSPKHAIPLSKATIFGNAVAIYFFNFKRKHPNKPNVPIINYAVAALMEPPTLIGSIFGVMMNDVFPNWLILLLLVALLSFVTYKTYLKGNKIRAKETKRKKDIVRKILTGKPNSGTPWCVFPRFDVEIAAKRWLALTRCNCELRELERQDHADFKSLPPLQQRVPATATMLLEKKKLDLQDKHETVAVDDNNWTSTLQCIQRREALVFPLVFIIPLLFAWLLILLQSLLRGGHGAPSIIGVTCNSLNYWLLTILPLSILVVITLSVGHHLRLENRLKVYSEYPFADGDIHWIKRRVLFFPASCVMAGIAAGLLGVGGGMVKGPIMLEMGILPPVQTSTASFMILFTSSSTTLQFAVNGQFPGSLQYDYVAWFAFVGFLGGLCGQKVVAYLVKKYKRESIMVYILAGTIGLSAITMSIVGMQNSLKDLETGTHLGFNDVCVNE